MGLIVNCDGDDLPESKENNPYIGENKTEMDAYDRVWFARGGFLGGHPTLEYLKALKRELMSWEHRVDDEIAAMLFPPKEKE
jgi:hypothetical protein